MSKLRKAANQARTALANARDYIYLLETGDVSWSEESQLQEIKAAIFALKKALAEPEQPMASAQGPKELWLQLHGDCTKKEQSEPVDYTDDSVTWCWHPIYDSDVRYVRADLVAAPTPRKPLTDEEIQTIWAKTFEMGSSANTFARAIERAHGIGKDK